MYCWWIDEECKYTKPFGASRLCSESSYFSICTDANWACRLYIAFYYSSSHHLQWRSSESRWVYFNPNLLIVNDEKKNCLPRMTKWQSGDDLIIVQWWYGDCLVLIWWWPGADLDLIWSWSAAGLVVIWSCSGADLALISSWSGADLELIWNWSGADLDLIWSWSASVLELIWTWSGADLMMHWWWNHDK